LLPTTVVLVVRRELAVRGGTGGTIRGVVVRLVGNVKLVGSATHRDAASGYTGVHPSFATVSGKTLPAVTAVIPRVIRATIGHVVEIKIDGCSGNNVAVVVSTDSTPGADQTTTLVAGTRVDYKGVFVIVDTIIGHRAKLTIVVGENARSVRKVQAVLHTPGVSVAV